MLPDLPTQDAVAAEVVSAVRQELTPWLRATDDPLQGPPAQPSVSLASSYPTARNGARGRSLRSAVAQLWGDGARDGPHAPEPDPEAAG